MKTNKPNRIIQGDYTILAIRIGEIKYTKNLDHTIGSFQSINPTMLWW